MTRRGFALLAVLWTVAGLGAVVAFTLADLRVGERATQNRLLLTRARWAAEACLAIAAQRHAAGQQMRPDTIALGRSTRCSVSVADPLAGLNVNLTDSATLSRCFELLGARRDSAGVLAGHIVARRRASPIESLRALAEDGVPESILRVLTVEGTGEVSATADPAVLGAIAERGRPGAGLGIGSQSSRLLLTSHGWVDGDSTWPGATIELLVDPQQDRLAVLRRRSL